MILYYAYIYIYINRKLTWEETAEKLGEFRTFGTVRISAVQKSGTTLCRDNSFHHSDIVPIDGIHLIFDHTSYGLNAYLDARYDYEILVERC